MAKLIVLVIKCVFFQLQADLVHLGAKYSPCIRDDDNIQELLTAEVKEENKTACCVNNDGSGCVQASRSDCSVSHTGHLEGRVCNVVT